MWLPSEGVAMVLEGMSPYWSLSRCRSKNSRRVTSQSKERVMGSARVTVQRLWHHSSLYGHVGICVALVASGLW